MNNSLITKQESWASRESREKRPDRNLQSSVLRRCVLPTSASHQGAKQCIRRSKDAHMQQAVRSKKDRRELSTSLNGNCVEDPAATSGRIHKRLTEI